jgi:hypothetical protein
MLQNVKNYIPAIHGSNYLLAVANKKTVPSAPTDQERRCRFDLFIRISPGNPGINAGSKGLQRTWCYRGDKYTQEEYKMLRNLLKIVVKNVQLYDRIELYDNQKAPAERILLKMTDGIIERNRLQLYELMLLNYPLPDYLKITV